MTNDALRNSVRPLWDNDSDDALDDNILSKECCFIYHIDALYDNVLAKECRFIYHIVKAFGPASLFYCQYRLIYNRKKLRTAVRCMILLFRLNNRK